MRPSQQETITFHNITNKRSLAQTQAFRVWGRTGNFIHQRSKKSSVRPSSEGLVPPVELSSIPQGKLFPSVFGEAKMDREIRIRTLNYEWKQLININASPSCSLKTSNKPIASGILMVAIAYPGVPFVLLTLPRATICFASTRLGYCIIIGCRHYQYSAHLVLNLFQYVCWTRFSIRAGF